MNNDTAAEEYPSLNRSLGPAGESSRFAYIRKREDELAAVYDYWPLTPILFRLESRFTVSRWLERGSLLRGASVANRAE